METYAIHKGAMIKPRLARMTMDLIRGKSVSEARNILNTTNTKASSMILKVLPLIKIKEKIMFVLLGKLQLKKKMVF